jgi:nitrogen fixation protein NifU and related proteins
MTDLYQEIILEEYKNPQNRGIIADADLILADQHLSCGDTVKIYVKLDSKKEKIIDLKWEGKGCAISMASVSILSAAILQRKMSLAEVKMFTQTDLEKMLGLENIMEGRVGCLTLGLQALQKS